MEYRTEEEIRAKLLELEERLNKMAAATFPSDLYLQINVISTNQQIIGMARALKWITKGSDEL